MQIFPVGLVCVFVWVVTGAKDIFSATCTSIRIPLKFRSLFMALQLKRQAHDGPSTSIFYSIHLRSPISLTLESILPPLPPTPLPILPLSPTPSTSHCIQCYLSADLVLLYPVYVCYIDILLISLTDEATIKPKRFI